MTLQSRFEPVPSCIHPLESLAKLAPREPNFHQSGKRPAHHLTGVEAGATKRRHHAVLRVDRRASGVSRMVVGRSQVRNELDTFFDRLRHENGHIQDIS